MLTERLAESVAALGSTDLVHFRPELLLVGTILLLLLAPVLLPRPIPPKLLATLGVLVALFALVRGEWLTQAGPPTELFGGMLIHDSFRVLIRLFLLTTALLVLVLAGTLGRAKGEAGTDYSVLLLGAVLGMSLMAAANHLLMVFLAVEMASVPSYALSGFHRGRRASSEAALKFAVFGGAAAGIMLYGLTLLGGTYGTLHLPTLAARIGDSTLSSGDAFDPVLLFALVAIFVGLAFKLSAVPFHFWCPDVFQGAPAEIAGFLSVASKGAAVALVGRLTLTLATHSGGTPLADYLTPVLALLAVVTCTVGNLAAYAQTSLKRLLAYSTIAHAGYMLMALATLETAGVQAATFYLFVYVFMNLGAFAIVGFLEQATGSDDLADYSGMVYRAPWLTAVMGVMLLSLTGLPPLAGFVAKFHVFAALYEYGATGHRLGFVLLGVAVVNTVISLVYYVNVLRVMALTDRPQDSRPAENGWQKAYVAACAAAVVFFGVWMQPIGQLSERAIRTLPAARQPVTHAVPDAGGDADRSQLAEVAHE